MSHVGPDPDSYEILHVSADGDDDGLEMTEVALHVGFEIARRSAEYEELVVHTFDRYADAGCDVVVVSGLPMDEKTAERLADDFLASYGCDEEEG